MTGASAPEPTATERLRKVVRAALAAYDLPPEVEVRPVRLLNNAVFEVTGPGLRLALRVHRAGYRSADQVRSELRLLRALDEELSGSRFAVPRPVAARGGDLLISVDGGAEAAVPRRHCDLLTWIDGRVLKHGHGLGRRSAYLLGEGLARVHEVGRELDASAPLDLPRWDAEALLSDASPFGPGRMREFLGAEGWTVFHAVVERTQRTFDELDRSRSLWGIVHNDYVLVNCLFRRRAGGWTLGILDFDDAGRGCLLYDLAPLLGNLYDWPDAYGPLRRAFLAGYRSVRSLPVELERHLPVLMAARHGASLTWLAAKARRGETDVPIARHVEIRVAEMERCLALLGHE